MSTNQSAGVPPLQPPVHGTFTLKNRPDLEFYDLENVVISGWVVDVTCDGTSYPFGTCTHPGGDGTTWYFCFDEFGWSSWPDAAGLMCGLHYAMTGQKLPGVAA